MTFNVNTDALKRKDRSGAVSGERVEIGTAVFVLAAYDPKTDIWLIAPASRRALEMGAFQLTGEAVHTYAIRLDLSEVQREAAIAAERERRESEARLQADPAYQEAVRKLFS